jgi:dipeptidyl aminopeptidase/acylaminoacyl peptidase
MKKLFSGLLLLGLCLPSSGQKIWSPEDIWKLRLIRDPQISPDGKTILYAVKTNDLAANKGQNDLYTISTEGGKATILTQTPVSEFNARWRPDGKKIGFLLGTESGSQLFEMNPDGTGTSKVSNEPGGMDGFEYAPSGDKILFYKSVLVQKKSEALFQGLPKTTGQVYDGLLYRHWTDWHDGTFQHVFVQDYKAGELQGKALDIMEGEPFDAPLKPMGGIEQMSWRPDGKALVYTCKKQSGTADAISTNSDIYLYETDSRKTTNLSEPNAGYDTEARFSPDGQKIAWQSMERDGYEADKNRLLVKDLKTGKITDATLMADITIENLVWSSKGESIYFLVQDKGTIQIYAWNSKAKPKVSIQAITKGDFNYTSLSLCKSGKSDILIGTRQNMNRPNEIVKTDPSTGKEQILTDINGEFLSGFKPCRIEKKMIPSSDGKTILTWLVYPPDFDPAKKYPAVLMCQGGPQSMVGQNFSLRWNFQTMASQGYIMILPNRRGLPGFGKDWNEQISGQWGGLAMQDLLSVTDFMAKEPYVDAGKVAAAGASFGGYSVYWLAGNHQKRFKAFIAHCGVFNLESMFGATEEIWFSNWDMKGAYWQEPRPESYSRFSPHLFVKNWDTPMLVIHNDKDFRVPLTEGLQAFTAAQLRNVKSRFLYFPDEGHWVLKPQNSVLWNRVFFDWLGQNLR